MWYRVTVPKLRVPVAAEQSCPSWGFAPFSVGFLVWMGNSAQTTGCRVKLFLLWIFPSQKSLTHKMLGYDHISVGTRALNQEYSALVGTNQKEIHSPLKSLHSKPRILSGYICNPTWFLKQTVKFKQLAREKTLQFLKGKRTPYPNDSWLCGWSNGCMSQPGMWVCGLMPHRVDALRLWR